MSNQKVAYERGGIASPTVKAGGQGGHRAVGQATRQVGRAGFAEKRPNPQSGSGLPFNASVRWAATAREHRFRLSAWLSHCLSVSLTAASS